MNSWTPVVTHSFQYSQFAAVFLDVLLKSFVILIVAGGVCLCWLRGAASARHLVWFLAVAGVLCLPGLSRLLPAWQRPLWAVGTHAESENELTLTLEFAPAKATTISQRPTPAPSPAGVIPAPGTAQAAGGQRLATHFRAGWAAFLLTVWLGGAVIILLSVVVGRLRLRTLRRAAQPPSNAEWLALLRRLCEELRVERLVTLLQTADDVMPATWGWWRPVILLPAEADAWSPERRRVVLLHELAHVKRWDCLTQTIARLACAVYWFNPLVWVAARRMCIERERACDDLVLNDGCKASDYAAHLVEIARTFRRVPQVAAIAMARSSNLEGRIAAIVDGSRNRRLRSETAMMILAVVGGITLCLGGSKTNAVSNGPNESKRLRAQQMARLEAFSAEKEKQSQALAAAAGETISPEFQRFFAAATNGDWQTVTNMYASFKNRHPQYSNKHQHSDLGLRTSFWSPVLEISMAYDHVVTCEPKYTQFAVDGIINSIPAGSIYFGGTDPGRALPTAFCKSHVDADPFYTLTQNALADGTYLAYLRSTYGKEARLLSQLAGARRADSQLQALDAEWQVAVQKLDSLEMDEADPQYKAAEEAVTDLRQKRDERMNVIQADIQAHADAQKTVGFKDLAETQSIYIPTAEDSQKSFQEYLAGAQRRLKEKKLKPGEDVRMNEGKVQVSGQVAVMSINGLLAKIIFDRNPDREFYIEESFPLDWMYPYLSPNGLIMKVNRQPLPSLSEELVQQDHEYWSRYLQPMLGDWLNYDTSVAKVAAFVEKVYLKHDLGGFMGDPQFVEDTGAQKAFSKLRSSIGGVYAWRITDAKTSDERQRMTKEADFAFRQSFALCPISPEALFRYVNLLLSLNRTDDARLLVETSLKLDPKNAQDKDLLEHLRDFKLEKRETGQLIAPNH
ncbi:MAG: bla regulator protein blaR1 [Verrucomicrobiota bacterium]